LFHFYSLDSPKSLGYCFPQECDTFTCEPASTCHRCTAPRKEFLSTAEFASKSSLERRRDITSAAAGKGIHLRGMREGEPVVDWGKAPDHIHKPGPNAANYERFRESAGAHLVFNAFWKIQHFCVHQMLMRDPMHQIDLGAIIHLIKAILRKFNECVETALDQCGLAAKRLGQRFQLMLAKRNGRDGQRYVLCYMTNHIRKNEVYFHTFR
jgi:hypothetical protein